MSFFKETPRILSIIFIITGIIGFIWNAGTLIELSEISQLHNGLSVLGQVYRIFSVAFLFIAIILFFGGIAFKQVATKAPKIILYAILLAVMLKVGNRYPVKRLSARDPGS